MTAVEIPSLAPGARPKASASPAGLEQTSGPIVGGLHLSAFDVDISPTTTTEFGVFDEAPQPDATARDGHSYAVGLCTDRAATVTGMRVVLI